MRALDTWLIVWWVATSVAGAIALVLPGVGLLLMFTIIGIPLGLLLYWAPGAWLYLTPTLLTFAILRGRVPDRWCPALLLASALPPLVVGTAMPLLANREVDRRAASLAAADRGDAIALPRGASVTYLADAWPGDESKCEDYCQRLLISGAVSSYVEAPVAAFGRLGALSSPVIRYSIGPPDDRCSNAMLSPAYPSDREAGPGFPKPLLWSKLQGVCIRGESTSDVRSDYFMLETNSLDRKAEKQRSTNRLDLSLHHVGPFRRWEVLQRRDSGYVQLMRRTHLQYSRLAVPLWLQPPEAMHAGRNVRWMVTGPYEVGRDIEAYRYERWEPWITNDLTVHGLKTQ